MVEMEAELLSLRDLAIHQPHRHHRETMADFVVMADQALMSIRLALVEVALRRLARTAFLTLAEAMEEMERRAASLEAA